MIKEISIFTVFISLTFNPETAYKKMNCDPVSGKCLGILSNE